MQGFFVAAGLGALVLSAPSRAHGHGEDEEDALKQALYLSCTSQLNAGTLPIHGTVPGSVATFVVNSAKQGTAGGGLTCADLTWTKFLTKGPTAVAFQGVERTLQGDPENQDWDCWHSSASYAVYRKRTDGTWTMVGGGGASGHLENGVCKYDPAYEDDFGLPHWGTSVVSSAAAGEYRIAFFNWVHSAPDPLHVYYYCSQSPEGNCNLPVRFTVANNSGVPHIGVFRAGKWWLDMDGDNLWSSRDSSYTFGQAGDKPVVMAPAECTNGTSYADIAVLRNPSSWYLTRNDLVWQSTDVSFIFGTNGQPAEWNNLPVSWESSKFYVDWNGSLSWNAGDLSFPFQSGDRPVIARWNSADERLGVFKAGKWYVDLSGNNAYGAGDASWSFGSSGELPVVADFNGDGIDNIATFNNGTWYVDLNGNHQWDGAAGGDVTYSFGQAGDIPVVAPKNGWRCKKPSN